MDDATLERGKSADGRVPVVEVFGPTIQGEGAMIGVKTHFVRLGGCDYRCAKCDSMHAVDPNAVHKNASWMTALQLRDTIAEYDLQHSPLGNCNWVTISGGNPALWEMGDFVRLMHNHQIKVAVETQGSVFRHWLARCDQITVSPKGPGMNAPQQTGEKLELFLDQLEHEVMRTGVQKDVAIKVVVFDQRDLEFAVEINRILDFRLYPYQRYLSLGNPWPPELQNNLELGPHPSEEILPINERLLARYREALEMDYLNDARLSKWRFLPQLHVLLWNNQGKV
jgi:7-carboxy-7-deazaguanine synthase